MRDTQGRVGLQPASVNSTSHLAEMLQCAVAFPMKPLAHCQMSMLLPRSHSDITGASHVEEGPGEGRIRSSSASARWDIMHGGMRNHRGKGPPWPLAHRSAKGESTHTVL